jgi:hypothetical protein
MSFTRLFIFFLFLAPAFYVFGDDAANVELDRAVDKTVIQLKNGDEHAEEYRTARRYHTIELDNPSSKYVVALFTIENFSGGNNYHFYLALLKPKENKFYKVDAIEIGREGYRHVDFKQVSSRDNKIIVGILEYLRDEQNFDANCCPSKKNEAMFELSHGKLHEVSYTVRPPKPMSGMFVPNLPFKRDALMRAP